MRRRFQNRFTVGGGSIQVPQRVHDQSTLRLRAVGTVEIMNHQLAAGCDLEQGAARVESAFRGRAEEISVPIGDQAAHRRRAIVGLAGELVVVGSGGCGEIVAEYGPGRGCRVTAIERSFVEDAVTQKRSSPRPSAVGSAGECVERLEGLCRRRPKPQAPGQQREASTRRRIRLRRCVMNVLLWITGSGDRPAGRCSRCRTSPPSTSQAAAPGRE